MADEPTTDVQAGPSGPPATGADRSQARTGPGAKHIAIAIAILGVGIVVTALTSDVTRVSEPGVRLVDGQPFLPEKAGDWTGSEQQGLTEAERAVLPADTEGARRRYTDTTGNQVFCSMILAGRDVASIHRPELCLPGQGWKIGEEYSEQVRVPQAEGGHLKVMRMNATHTVTLPDGRTAEARHVFVYWFVGKDRVTPYHWQRTLWTSMDRVFHNTNHRWAYLLIYAAVTKDSTGAGSDRSGDETMQLLGRFVQDIYPALAVDEEKQK